MMPIHQSIEGQPPHMGPGLSPPAATAGENGERQQKPKTLPCKYCSKRFRRVEHVQRHERTHTKEKPFSCGWARCGKTFGRRDLLVRHEKLVHLNEGNSGPKEYRPRKSSGAGGHQASSSESHAETEVLNIQRTPVQAHQQPQHQQHQQHQPHHNHQQLQPQHYHQDTIVAAAPSSLPQDARMQQARAAACNLDMLSDAALASEVNPMQPMMADMGQSQSAHARIKSYDEQMGYSERAREDQPPLAPGFASQAAPNPYDDYHLFLDDFAGSSHFLPPAFEPDQQMGGMWPRQAGDMHQRGLSKPASQFPSRFPSVQPDGISGMDGQARGGDEPMRAPSLRISAVDHNVIKNRLDEFSSVLPADFIFPSRHTLTRFLEGYISGFHEYLPFLHLPSLAPAEIAPELLLAILAVGAQYRFESHRGHALWYAAKAVALEQIRRRHSHEVHALLPTPAAYSPHSTRPSPSTGFRHTFASAQQERPMTQDTHREPFSPNTPQARLETIQAVLLLFAVGLWGASAILHEALSLQSHLAILVREEGLTAESSPGAAPDWETWVRLEGASRTKLIAYCFFNLCSIASLETRDHMLIASSLSNTPLLVRSLRLQKAVFQAIHALSMLVKAGVNYVARTKSLEWSIQHSLGNFECAVLLSKWLLTLSSIGPNDQPVSTDEKNFLEMIRRMLDETEFAVPIDPSLGGPAANPPSNMEALAGDSTRLRQLAAAVIRLWAETFKGTHIFDLVRVMGSSLDGYASLVEKPHDRAPMGRIAAEAGLG
ncbi:Transcriptional regulator ADR1 like protein [Verticillium longisporum]|nr:Transcriptional regulator ADR1 like protein [Verticillium longisporum]